MRSVTVVLVLLGCTRSPPPQQHLADPTDHHVVVPIDASPPVDATPPADVAPPIDARTGRVVEVPGRGTCEVDADCVLTAYQEGCCVQACQGYASSALELATRKSKENCAARGNAICPPPSPCRRQTHKVLSAACRADHCVSVEEELP